MNKIEHQNLVRTIQGVHDKLRKSLHMSQDTDEVWQEHIKEEELRKKYSSAMLKLATEIWVEKECRIKWSYKTCIDYFYHGGLERYLLRQKKIKGLQKMNCIIEDEEDEIKSIYLDYKEKLKLLDIGSCYNPFSKFPEFSCTAIDLTPATEDVLQCDFLQLDIQKNSDVEANNHSNLILYEESFDIVVMSLVLEYLPASEQRTIFCFKAWQLLKQNGLCVVITPDSKSMHSNAPMIKSWKLALEKIGFKRVKYDKLTHLHCMAFSKVCKFSEVNIANCKLLSDLLYIPQDFKSYSDVSSSVDRNEEENKNVCMQFSELPNEDLF
ncbi:s-adenosylmethionine sensor upstream of mTORC1 [Caerostris extrusa]|uniref:S-adenosylmethionine sensor upstream of mTORC1 n=1 Tax=Caerostris extrusa TaxID=172846 RepID=A0AAV4M5A2_CAEEX|nr:s-adenosylmethionine sensor upstream of mTORC1 [Caerostris extrusa]